MQIFRAQMMPWPQLSLMRLRQKLAGCWSVPPGAREANITVKVRFFLNPDGSVAGYAGSPEWQRRPAFCHDGAVGGFGRDGMPSAMISSRRTAMTCGKTIQSISIQT